MKPKIPMRYALQDPYIFGRQGQFILGRDVLLIDAAGEKLTTDQRVEY
jgi:hypothetical protein